MRLLEMHIEVADLERSIGLYSQLLTHTKVIKWNNDSAAALVMPDGCAFGLWTTGHVGLHGGRAATHLHFAFQIRPDEYDRCHSHLRELGLKVIEHNWENGKRSLYFFDYDGHQGELMTGDWSRGPGDQNQEAIGQ